METPVTPVAIIGMGCRLPGGIDSPDLLWEALLRGDDLVTEIPAERWDADNYYDPEPGVPGRTVSRWGGFIDDIAGFDAEFFGISEREATSIDPQHRILLETSWEAIEHAGLDPASLSGSATSVYTGLTHEDYLVLTKGAGGLASPYVVTGLNNSVASGRISYALGLHGPAMTFDTACSSGLMAVHLACRSLQDGESDLALAGGCAVLLEPDGSVATSAQGMLSSTGRCQSFDADADGFVRSEGCAMVLLKRLPDALRDGNRILAVVRGTATNQDGRTETLTMPSEDAQVAVYRAALAAAGVAPETVGAVEAHGTGTPVGDPIEFRSLARVYGGAGSRCALGSAKSNMGHSESAAGAVGLIKAVLSLRHGVVPPLLHFNRLPDELAEIETGIFVPQTVTPWPSNGDGTPKRIAVSSFGMSGTNVHAILEQAPAEVSEPAPAPVGPQLFALSSSSADGLRATATRLAEWVEQHPDVALSDLAYTLARRRAHRPVRTTVVAASSGELVERLREVAEGDGFFDAAVGQNDRGPVWVFSGQGSQWAAMGADLLANEPVFAETVAELEPVIAAESGFSVTEAMTAPQTVTGIDRVQPTLFAMQVALAATADKTYGIRPGAVVGHSLGEAAAAVVAGALSLEDGARVICRRSRLMSRIAGSGAMASVELPAKQVNSELMARGIDDVAVSVVASPQSTVIGGATDVVRELVARWEQRDVMAREVAVDVASHSPQVDPILDDLAAALTDIAPTAPKVPYYSATLFDPREQPLCDGRYWVDNLRNTVQFAAAVQAAMEDGFRVFAELSPHPLLTHAVDQTARNLDMSVAALAGMRREQPLPLGLRGLLSDVHSAGAAVDFSVLYPAGRLVDTPLPAWTHPRLFIDDDGQAQKAQGACTITVHPLLGSHVRLTEEPERHVWQTDVGTSTLTWLDDHQVRNVAALPGAAYCEMALAAAGEVFGQTTQSWEVRDIAFEQMLLLDEETSVEGIATAEASGVFTFAVETHVEGENTRHAVAALSALAGAQEGSAAPPAYDIAALLEAHPVSVNGAQLRESFVERGIQHGPAFSGLTTARTAETGGSTVLAEVALPASIRFQQAAYQVHPALLDACFQSVAAGVVDSGGSGLLLPLGVRSLRVYGPTRNTHYCYTRVTKVEATGGEADLDLLAEDGTVLLAVRGLQMGTGTSESGERTRVLSERLLTLAWQQRSLPEVVESEAASVLLIDTSDAADLLVTALADALKAQGAECANLHWPIQAGALQSPASAESVGRLHSQLRARPADTVVILCGPSAGAPDEAGLLQGREQVRHLVRISRELAELEGELPRLFVVTRQAQVVRPEDEINLEQAGLRGLLRVIGSEHPLLRTTQIDVDEHTQAEQLAQQLLCGSEEDETAWRNGEWHVARLCPSPLSHEERHTATVDPERDGLRMQVRTPGDLQTLELAACDRIPPGPGQIEVAVAMSSINFADVLIAFGKFPIIDDREPQLGMDFVGVVTAVGEGVTDHNVGDRVGGFSEGGCWRTFLTCQANLAVTLPPALTDEQAISAATANATAWYGLNDLAGIKAGDKVLIHSATGGVGQAAIAIARAAGAEIFATAGNPRKRALLHDMGIEHVYDSRSVAFAEQIRRDTDGYGVDIVLNSLTGAAQRAGLELLAFGGRFIEIGKADVYGNTRMGLYPFRRGLTFYYLDLALMTVIQPDRVRELLATVFQLTADGVLAAPERTHYPLADAASAIRAMSNAEHTGKLLLDIPRSGRAGVVVPPEQAPVFRRDGAYIITGGLGGLGLYFASKLAAGGCGRIVLTARNQPNPKARQTIERLRKAGTDIVVECGNIAEPDTAERLVSAATADGVPLRGVLHAAAVVEDATLTNISDELIDRDWAPKVYGSWNLHRATVGQPLDWFCLFSSGAALLGSPGQGAYAAANSWVDAFAQWRRAQNLPADAIAWGAWGEVGRATFLAEGGEIMIAPEEGAYAFETLLRYDRTYTGYIPIIGAPWLADLVRRSPWGEMFASTGQSARGPSKFRAELIAQPQDEWPALLRRMIVEQASIILRRTVDADRPFIEYGLDSLGMLEMRTHIETETGIRLTPKVLATHNTGRSLAQHLADTLAEEETAHAAS